MPNIGSAPKSLNFQDGLIVQSSSAVRTDPMVELYADPTTHRLLVDAGSITTTNAANGSTGAAVPATATYIAASKAGTLTGLLLGSQTGANSLGVVLASDQAALAVTGTFWQATQPVSIASMPSTPVTGTFWQATQPVSGTVTANISGSISNTSFASTIADGADVTLGAKADAKSTATDTTAISAMSVLKQISASVQAPPSQAVTNAGTFAVQSTPVTQADTFMLGGVNIKEINAVTPLMGSGVMGTGSLRVTIASDNDALIVKQATAANLNATVVGTGTFAVQSTPVTQADTFMLGGVNIKEINAVTPLMGNGTTGTGSLRVTIASDNTAFSVNSTLSAETTKVIGVTRTADGAGNLLTSNSTTYTAKFGLDGNLLGTLGTAFSTAGKVDVKAADGDVFVRQATGSNLHMVVDSGTVTTVSTVTAVTSITNQVDTNLKQVGGTNTVTGGVAGTLAVGGNVATNVAIGTNPINLGAQAVSSENTAVTTARMAQLVTDLVGKLIVLPFANPENFVNGTTAAITDTTTTSIIASAGGSLRNYITDLTVTNSHATVGTFVKITDGASTILWEGYAAAAGGGFAKSFSVPLRGTAATAVNAICVTTGANVIVSAGGYKGI